MKFIDYFDPYNPTHVEAFEHQEKAGWWPLWFAVKVNQTDKHQWIMIAMAKCSQAWVEYVEWKQKCKTEFIPIISVNKDVDTKKLADLVIKEINKRIKNGRIRA